MKPHLRAFLTAIGAGMGAGIGVGLVLWAHTALASASNPPPPVQLCAKSAGVVVYAASGSCPANTTAIAPVAQQAGVASLFSRLDADEAAISTLQGQVSTLQGQVSSLQAQEDSDAATIASLQNLLKGVSRGSVGGYDTLTFSGINVQVVNGTGSESTTNGLGNLIVGYSDKPAVFVERTGSHNLITGDQGEWTSYGGLLTGFDNQITAPYASVSGGQLNTASAFAASVSGGLNNRATGSDASVSGGRLNTASGEAASVSGGRLNRAMDIGASVSGGLSNTASGFDASVSGGELNTAFGNSSAILGGYAITILAGIHCGYFPDSPTTSNCA